MRLSTNPASQSSRQTDRQTDGWRTSEVQSYELAATRVLGQRLQRQIFLTSLCAPTLAAAAAATVDAVGADKQLH